MTIFTGTAGADTANASNGTLTGFTGGTLADLQDGNGDEFVLGGGADTVVAGSGGDIFEIAGSVVVTGSTLNGGGGLDTVRFTGFGNFVHDLTGVTLTSIERLELNDSEFGNSRTVMLDADQFGGGFSLTGVVSFDIWDDNFEIIQISMGADTSLDLSGLTFTGSTTNASFEITGDNSAETISGSSIDDEIYGGGGNDTIIAGSGNDIVDAGSGDDFLRFSTGAPAVYNGTWDGGDGLNDRIFVTGSDGIVDVRSVTFLSVEEVQFFFDGTSNERTLLMNAGQFGAGEVSLSATIDGNEQAGSINRIDVFMGLDTVLDLSGLSFIDWDGNDVFRIVGDGDDETITGTTQNDTIEGGAGADSLNGGNGTDTASYADSAAGVTIDLVINSASGGDAEGDTFSSIENLTGSAHGDVLIGNGDANVIEGGDGADFLFGFTGIDRLYGGDGDDFLVVQDGYDEAGETYDGGADTDTLNVRSFTSATYNFRDDTVSSVEALHYDSSTGGSVEAQFNADQFAGFDAVSADAHSGQTYRLTLYMDTATILDLSGVSFTGFNEPGDGVTIIGDVDAETITGSSVADFINGGVGNDTIYGGDGNDTITDSGRNSVYGGGGDDVIVLTFISQGLYDGGTETDTLDASQDLFSGLHYDLSASSFFIFGAEFTNFENVIDNDGSNTLTGNDSANILTGNGGNDQIFGGIGDDTLSGGDGNDTVRGGAGADTLSGGAGFDTLNYADSNDAVQVFLGGNTATGGHATGDTISGFENAVGSNFDDRLFGSAQVNLLDGGAGSDILLGNNGNDTLRGREGRDIIYGGNDNDTFVYLSLTDSGLLFADRDRIQDFTDGEDLFNLSALDADSGTAGNQAFSFVGRFFSGNAGELRSFELSGLTFIEGDVDGDGVADFRIELLGTGLGIDAGDFVL